MEIEEKFIKDIKYYDNVIIYGYADIGVTILDYIIEMDTSIKIANYSGRVKFFSTSEREPIKKRKEIKGIKIKPIYSLLDYKDALIIIATKEIHHDSISKLLDSLGFFNRLYVSHEMYCILREKVDSYKTLINNNIQNYHINHQIKLDRLRQKVKLGGKVKVFFMTHDSAVFGCASIYREMDKNELFEPYIYVVSRRDVEYSDFPNEVEKNVSFFKNKGYRVIRGYDENYNLIDLHSLNPDILFYDLPKLYGPAGNSYNRMDQLNWEYLTCYVPYGLLMVDSFYYHYHTKCIRETWRFFADTVSDYKRMICDGDFNGFNTVFSGYPKLDEYKENEEAIPNKINNSNRIVIYAPHHSLFVSNNFATFDLYKDLILDFVKEKKDINFVFKPHPLLRFQINSRYREGRISFSEDDYNRYIEEWNSIPNGYVMDEGDYIGLFKKSDCMITDCGSFIGEYFPSQRPCIYLLNPRKNNPKDVYTPLANRILETYYLASSEQELKDLMDVIIIQKKDKKKKEREQIFKEEFSNFGKAGKYITNYLESVIK